MSDGTKQGNALQVSDDFKNMLKTAFENKTGDTIGYFIFHVYTEETVDIESSITINSGATPTKTLFKWGIGRNRYSFLAGELVEKAPQTFDAKLYYFPNNSQIWAVTNPTGEVYPSGQTPDNYLSQMMLEDIGAKIEAQVDQIILIPSPANVGETIPEWDNYIDCTP